MIRNQRGSILNIALLISLLIFSIGLFVHQTSSTDINIAGNDKAYKVAFYMADGGGEAGHEVLELNISCPNGFDGDEDDPLQIGGVEIIDKDFWQQESAPGAEGTYPADPADPADPDTDIFRDIRLPADDSGPHTNLAIFGNTALSTGSAVQMAAGYEGKGKGAGAGGAYILYEVHSQHLGRANSLAEIMTQWKHVIGQEDECKY